MKLIAKNLNPGQGNFMTWEEDRETRAKTRTKFVVHAAVVGEEVWFYDLILGEDVTWHRLHNPSAESREFAQPLYLLAKHSASPVAASELHLASCN
jgi:hypothetical protein